jgi:hypothetical protein
VQRVHVAIAGHGLDRTDEHASPCALEVEHDSVYRAETEFTIDREILLPLADEPDHEPDTQRATPLHVVAALLEFAADHPEREVVVYGHADTAGDAGHNAALSEQRARNVQLYLAGIARGGPLTAKSTTKSPTSNASTRWAAERFAWATDPGPLDNEWTSTARPESLPARPLDTDRLRRGLASYHAARRARRGDAGREVQRQDSGGAVDWGRDARQ